MKLLVIEDDADLREIIVRSLEKERYVVETAADCATARMKVFVYEYDCLLLDIMLPDGSGLDILREMSARGRKCNVIILSAKDSIEDKVTGLDLGADDYLAKPFHLAELHARLKSVMRRSRNDGDNVMRMANVCVHTDSFMVEQMLAEAVWGDYIDVADNFDFVYAQMKNLRKRLRAAGAGLEIKTVYGFGYKLVEI